MREKMHNMYKWACILATHTLHCSSVFTP